MEKSSCPICREKRLSHVAQISDTEYFTTGDKFDYLQCDDCHTVFMEKPPVDRLGEIYPETYYSGDQNFNRSFLHQIKEKLEVRLFSKIFKTIPGTSLSVLDVGGGYGWILTTMRAAEPRIARTVVIDLDPAFRAKAESLGHKFICSPIEAVDTDERFDFINALNLIEHVADPRAVLKKLYQLLKPNGLLLIKTPNTDTLDRFLLNEYWGGFHCPRHFVLFNQQNFSKLAAEEGFAVTKAAYTQGASQWAAGMLGWLYSKGLIQMDRKHPVVKHPLFNPLMAIAAVFDYLRMPFSKTAQMFFLLQNQSVNSSPGA